VPFLDIIIGGDFRQMCVYVLCIAYIGYTTRVVANA